MKENLEIKPLIGFGDLKFGASKKEVESFFGSPQEVETLDMEGEDGQVEVWSYWDQGHSVYFEKELKDICSNFETDNESSILFGKEVFSLSKEEVMELMKEQGFAEVEEEKEDEELIIFFPDAHMQFVFEKDDLVLVSWAVAMDDKEKVLWPE